MARSIYDAVVAQLRAAKASTKCIELVAMLESLQFTVERAKSGNHRIYFNPELSAKNPAFTTANFDCGHGRDPQVKLPYVLSVLRVLRTYEAEIRELLGETK